MATINVGRVRPVAQGDYNPAVEYDYYDFVYYQGSSYLAVQTVPAGNTPPSTEVTDADGVTTLTPTSNEYWAILARAGSTTGVVGPQGPQGLQGSQGATGEQGPQGLVGETGQTGATGPQGSPGADGQSASVVVGTVTTGAPGTNVAVTNRGTSSAATLDFTIPRGNTGSRGPAGTQGPRGATGATGPVGPAGSGANMLQNDSRGTWNVAVGGDDAGRAMANRVSNVAIGSGALSAVSGSNNNTAVGYQAMRAGNFTTRENTCVGYKAGDNCANRSNSTCIGNGAAMSANNQITFGNAFISSLRCATSTISGISDVRDKEEINEIEFGLSLVNQLNPVSFTWNKRYLSEGERESGHIRQGERDFGFIAQELDELQQAVPDGENYLRFLDKSEDERWRVSEARLIPILVKAIQELSAKVAELES